MRLTKGQIGDLVGVKTSVLILLLKTAVDFANEGNYTLTAILVVLALFDIAAIYLQGRSYLSFSAKTGR